MTDGIVGDMMNAPVSEMKGFDAQIRAALYNIDHFDAPPVQKVFPKFQLADGTEVIAHLPKESARERGELWYARQAEEAIRRARARLPGNRLYALRPPVQGDLPRELITLPLGMGWEKGVTFIALMLLGLPRKAHLAQLIGSSSNPLIVPTDADLQDVTELARIGGPGWAARTYGYRLWLESIR